VVTREKFSPCFDVLLEGVVPVLIAAFELGDYDFATGIAALTQVLLPCPVLADPVGATPVVFDRGL